MTIASEQNQSDTTSNRKVVIMCLSLVLGMGGLSYASVPLYDLFCRVTGYGGTTQQVASADGVVPIEREINVRFDANTSSDLDWKFGPEQRQVTLKLGEKMIINYVAENLSDEPLVGMASFNVTPQSMGIFFHKIECFCFTDTYVEPGEKLEMPVVFYVDPDLDKEKDFKGLQTITLSYTFFESDTPVDEVAEDRSQETEEIESREKL